MLSIQHLRDCGMAFSLAVVVDGQTGRCAGTVQHEVQCAHNLLRPPQLVAFHKLRVELSEELNIC